MIGGGLSLGTRNLSPWGTGSSSSFFAFGQISDKNKANGFFSKKKCLFWNNSLSYGILTYPTHAVNDDDTGRKDPKTSKKSTNELQDIFFYFVFCFVCWFAH